MSKAAAESHFRQKYDDISRLQKIDDDIFHDICLHVDYCDYEIDRKLVEIAKLDKQILDLTRDGNETGMLSFLLSEKRRVIAEMDNLRIDASQLQPMYADLVKRRPAIIESRSKVTACIQNLAELEVRVQELQKLRDERLSVVKDIRKKMNKIGSACSLMTKITIRLAHVERIGFF
jgi:hypothetical protein